METVQAGFETARLALARIRVDGRKQCVETAQRAARVCAQALSVERVGVWLIEDDAKKLRCWAQYTASTDSMGGVETLDTAAFPAYFRAVTERRAIVADDARTDPATAELTDSYLVPHGITSMLDAPLYRDGKVTGIVCHEHVGPPRHFTEREVDFACSVADMVASTFEQAQRRELEAELRDKAARASSQAQLDELSRLSRSVAHDFTNVLTGVGLISQQLRRLPAVAELGKELGDLVGVGTRLCAELAEQQQFGDDGVRTRADQVLREMRSMLTSLVRDSGSLTVENGPEVQLTIRRTHLEQILLNLVVNARDALKPGGTVSVRLRNDGPDGFAVLEVVDDGSGMPPEIVAHIFEPYFTTKRSGSGLGLATVRELVHDAGGRIAVVSKPGDGTTFTVTLPRA
jgi:C4-dicarboxylate-specific signal transduction histidine kinase